MVLDSTNDPQGLWRATAVADRGLLLSWRGLGEQALSSIRALYVGLRRRSIGGVVDLVPGIDTLLICYDPLAASYGELLELVDAVLGDNVETSGIEHSVHRISVDYGGDAGPDLSFVASAAGLREDEVIALHTARAMPVLMIGFMPGFPYIGELPPELRLPRRAEPRVAVVAGSVAIANDQTGIYPSRSPGGWHVIGRTEALLFEPGRDPPALLRAGDWVQFEARARP